MRFVATIPPLRAVVEPVVGEPVGVLLRGGATPHAYEPRPSDARLAAAAEILFYGSEQLDRWAASLDTGRRVGLLDLLPDSARRLEGSVADPHFWLDPMAVEALVPSLVDTLCNADPPGCAAFVRRGRTYEQKLAEVDDSLHAMLAPLVGTPLLLAHPFLGYFADRYGLRVVAVIEPVGGGEPSPRDIQRLIEIARTTNARAVVTQPQHTSRAAEAVARAAGLPMVEVDPLREDVGLPELLYLTARTLRASL